MPMSKPDRHVVPNLKGGWSVRATGAERAARSFATEGEAVRFALDAARKAEVSVFVHGRDGMVRRRIQPQDLRDAG